MIVTSKLYNFLLTHAMSRVRICNECELVHEKATGEDRWDMARCSVHIHETDLPFDIHTLLEENKCVIHDCLVGNDLW